MSPRGGVTANFDETEKQDIAITGPALDPVVVKRLKLKADLILLPMLTLAYLFNSLDRSSVSNAHTAGLEEDLGLVGNQFNQVLTFYQVPFIVLGPAVTMVTKWIGARWTIPTMLLAFGCACLASGFAKSFRDIVVCRVFVVAFESGFLASVIYYLSVWYTRAELATRIGVFYAALVSSSAFGGLLAYAVFHIQDGAYPTWAYLFFLEGGLTVVWSLLLFALLPVGVHSAWFLNEEERATACARLEQDSVTTLEGGFSWREAFGEFRTAHGYIRVLLGFTSGVITTSNANFLAMIVKRLQFSVVKTNLYTIAPALTGAVFLVCWCKSSDYFRERGGHITASTVVSLIGYIILLTINTSNTAVLYFAMFLCTIGAYPTDIIGSAWTVVNIPNLNARAMMSGLYTSIGNCGGILSSNIYRSNEAPRFQT
ncbi:Lovastatin diketide synthase LovF [Purpureocillium lavendulum]|uniref:Lovastatin diketide synthase LovF n=1 Tax=Purpureocillium lavendulum TaxID=1247861 RepID=A0AB34FY63_9HYPO|nr:Lovastatin diketide synthase LovF [Purpureocillium lavendulum]